MAKRRIKGKYERFRLRPGKDDDLYDAIDYQVEVLKRDFADVARDALKAYLKVGIVTEPAIKEAQGKKETVPKAKKLVLDDSDLDFTKKEPTRDDLEARLSGFLGEDE